MGFTDSTCQKPARPLTTRNNNACPNKISEKGQKTTVSSPIILDTRGPFWRVINTIQYQLRACYYNRVTVFLFFTTNTVDHTVFVHFISMAGDTNKSQTKLVKLVWLYCLLLNSSSLRMRDSMEYRWLAPQFLTNSYSTISPIGVTAWFFSHAT